MECWTHICPPVSCLIICSNSDVMHSTQMLFEYQLETQTSSCLRCAVLRTDRQALVGARTISICSLAENWWKLLCRCKSKSTPYLKQPLPRKKERRPKRLLLRKKLLSHVRKLIQLCKRLQNVMASQDSARIKALVMTSLAKRLQMVISRKYAEHAKKAR